MRSHIRHAEADGAPKGSREGRGGRWGALKVPPLTKGGVSWWLKDGTALMESFAVQMREDAVTVRKMVNKHGLEGAAAVSVEYLATKYDATVVAAKAWIAASRALERAESHADALAAAEVLREAIRAYSTVSLDRTETMAKVFGSWDGHAVSVKRAAAFNLPLTPRQMADALHPTGAATEGRN